MRKCAVRNCRNSSNNVTIRDNVSFFHYPRKPALAKLWWSVLAPVLNSSFKPATSVICSDHFHDAHKNVRTKRLRLTKNAVPDLKLLEPLYTIQRSSTMLLQNEFNDLESSDDEANMVVDIPDILKPPSESMVCRVCLLTEGHMTRVTENNYEAAYKQVTGIQWNTEDTLPQHLCWECSHRLLSAAKFRRKALAALESLRDIRQDQSFLTLNDVKLIDRKNSQLVSTLTEMHFPPTEYLSEIIKDELQESAEQHLKGLDGTAYLETTSQIENMAEKDTKLDTKSDKCNMTLNYNTKHWTNMESFELEEKTLSTKANAVNFGLLASDLNCKYDTNLNNHTEVLSSSDTNNVNVEYLRTDTDDREADSYKTSNAKENLESDDKSDISYNKFETDTDTPGSVVDFEKNETKNLDSDAKDEDIADVKLDYDSDESDILVIDSERSNDMDFVEKSVDANTEGMSIDELIGIYNNNEDGDEKLQELNEKFKESTVTVEQGWGSQMKDGNNYCQEQNMPKASEKFTKIGSMLSEYGIPSRAYEKLNQTLFTLTPVSEEEQIADISKRQDTFRFKCAPFKCYLCFRSFQARRAYDAHMLRHDASNGAFECKVCKARQKSPRAIKTHMYGQHTVRISCNNCNFVTMNRSVARSHEKWHAGTKYKCPQCPCQYDQESTYKSHMRTRHLRVHVRQPQGARSPPLQAARRRRPGPTAGPTLQHLRAPLCFGRGLRHAPQAVFPTLP